MSSSQLTSLKLSFNGEIRRISVDLGDTKTLLTYNELVKTTLRIFPHLKSVQFSWVDDENDKVVIDSDDELFEALRVMTTEKKGHLRFEVTAKTESVTKDTNSGDKDSVDFGIIVHEGVQCDGCGQHPITGSRFKCTVRPDHDLCATCENKVQQLYPTVKIYTPNQVPAAILAVVEEQKGRRGGAKGARNGKHRGVTCDVCQSRNFTGCRYKCTVRPDYDLCSTCEAAETQPFAMIKFNKPNQLKSIEVIPNEEMAIAAAAAQSRDDCPETTPSKEDACASTERHGNIRCDGCGQKPLVGVRYKCSVRPDFDLCADCEAKNPQPHPMLKIYSPCANLFDQLQVGVSNSLGWLRGQQPSVQTRREDWRGDCKSWRKCKGKDSSARQAEDAKLEQEMLDQCIKESLEERERMEREALSESMMSDVTSSSFSTSASSASSDRSSKGRSLEELMLSASNPSASQKPKAKVKLMARFVQDVTMPDGSQVAPCSTFYKTWRVRNDGTCDWPEGCHLVSAGGDVLIDPKIEGGSAAFRQLVDPVIHGDEVDITVELYAPSATGRHVGYFRLEDPHGSLFGQRLWSDIRVTDADMSMSATLSPWQVVQPDGESTADEQHEEQMEEQMESAEEAAKLKPGRTVQLHSLQKHPELNGQVGSCKRWDEEAGIWEVELHADFRLVMLQPCNLTVWASSNEVSEEEEEEQEEEQEELQEQQEERRVEDHELEQEQEQTESVLTAEEVQEQADLQAWSQELEVLREMGFHEHSKVLPLLKTHLSQPASSACSVQGGGGGEQGLQAVVLALLAEP